MSETPPDGGREVDMQKGVDPCADGDCGHGERNLTTRANLSTPQLEILESVDNRASEIKYSFPSSHHRIGHLGASRQDWRTPRWLFDQLNAEFRFDFDAAASAENRLCVLYMTEELDALMHPWAPLSTFVNPPYAKLYPWVQKAYDESRKGATVVMLLPASTDTKWFHEIVQPHAEVRFLRGRLRFEGAEHPATFASMIVIFRPWQVAR